MAEFTKEQLIDEVKYNLEHCFCSEKTKRLMDIALAALTAAPEVCEIENHRRGDFL